MDVDSVSMDVTALAPRHEKHQQEITGGSEQMLPGAVLTMLEEY